MARFIRSNPGLESRFTQEIEFPSYSPEELLTIYHRMAESEGLRLQESAHMQLGATFTARGELVTNRFGNARFVRRLLEFTVRQQANRLSAEPTRSRSQLTTLLGDDVPRSPPLPPADAPRPLADPEETPHLAAHADVPPPPPMPTGSSQDRDAQGPQLEPPPSGERP